METLGQPFRAEFDERGLATILDAPPAESTPVQPGDPPPRTAEQIAADEQFQRVVDFQGRVSDDVAELSRRLEREERGNYVTVYYDNEGDPSVVFQFLRDGPETLRKYTQHPRFFAENVRWSMEQLQADARWMWETFREDRVLRSTGTGGGNQVTAEISVAAEEFRALVARKGVTIPESVELQFRAPPVVPLVNPPVPAARDEAVPAAVAPHIRIFPRHDRPAGPVNAIGSRVKVVLKDGCFRAADRDNSLVLFPFGANLFVDSESYLAFGDEEVPGYARVGETVQFMGSVNEVTEPELVDPIRAACGPGKVIKVEGLESAAARSEQQVSDGEVNAMRWLRDSYGLDEAQARRAYAWLEQRQAGRRQTGPDGVLMPPIGASMVIMSPPSPVMDPAICPPGSSLSFGLCRTPEGYLRPIPEWLAEFLEQDR
ncbi:hypothetical protein GRI40_12280 [Altererythrobacter aerius]|uniref:Uncharacterized protein n=1 Tax=Tsuneonella aeria TaxID=1837929 RepID=A0A6I4TFT0_9SPHN|nr:hypothetical protein [Tsuneonella aeria]MXO75993.1 hypothetical protein [Tsuneonella aeria]